MSPKSDPVFAAPPDRYIPLWRYMDFPKFVSMLTTESIFFTRLDQLSDPFEGAQPNRMAPNKVVWDEFYKNATKGDGVRVEEPPGIFGKKMHSMQLLHLRSYTFVSCWHMSEHESAAMWKLYARTEQAICVQTTFEKLEVALPEDANIGKVHYVDYVRDEFPDDNIFRACMHKRKSFEYEKEVRAVLDPTKNFPSPTPTGIAKKVDLRAMIENIYVAPTAPQWFADTVKATINAFGFDFRLCKSALDDAPVW